MGIALHITSDLITSYGTQIFAPLSTMRYTLSTTFIIDLWLMGLLTVGLVIALSVRNSRLPAVIACFAVIGYVGFQSVLRERALEFGATYARSAGLNDARVRALPGPLSPFDWVVVAQEPSRLRFANISLWRDRAPPPLAGNAGFFERVGAPYLPLADARWVERSLFGEAGDANAADRGLAEAAWREPAFASTINGVSASSGETTASSTCKSSITTEGRT